MMDKEFWKATGIRCLRSFLSVIIGAQSVNMLLTEIDWEATLLAAVSTTFWIFLACIYAGLPEVDAVQALKQLEELRTQLVTDGNDEEEDGITDESN